MWIDFKDYQEKAVTKLKREINELLDDAGNKLCVFKAPTGSGKTLMMAEFLRRLIDSRIDNRKFSFIWIAVHKLHDQSRNSLKKYYDAQGVGIKCSYFNDLNDRRIAENEILFLNWASINKKDKSLIIKENERDFYLSSVIERTKAEYRTIILIIDESHRNADTDRSKELIEEIGPKVTIEVSATPKLETLHGVEVGLDKVKDEEMIKKEIVINPDFESYKLDTKLADKTADEIVIEAGLKKRAELAKLYAAEGSSVNPLMLIQIPDAREGMVDKKGIVMKMLAKYGITTDNGRLAIYLSDKDSKINLENIEKDENEVEVMIFKQAIAVGWDCPRAAILVLFREWKSMVFSIQTIGRIMRMPEHHHYKNPKLNIGYVYTSLSDISVAEDIAKGYIKRYKGLRREDYKDIDLTSYHSKRFREQTRLSSDFVPSFFKAAVELKLKSRIKIKQSIVDTKIIASGRITDADKEAKKIEKKGTLDIPKNRVELQNAFDYFAREHLAPFAPELRSIKRINDSIYRFFDKTFNMGVDDWTKIQGIVLAEENRQAVIDTINKAKELYQEEIGKEKTEFVRNDKPWNVPDMIPYSDDFKEKKYKKSIIQPYYARVNSSKGSDEESYEDSANEELFIEMLEKAKQVKWWFKNGRQDATYFAVPYEKNSEKHPFYVDFVVMLNNGKIGLFDTKGGIYAETAIERANGLAKYIKDQSNAGRLFGGIVIRDKKSWRYNDSDKYSYDPKQLDSWKFLDLN